MFNNIILFPQLHPKYVFHSRLHLPLIDLEQAAYRYVTTHTFLSSFSSLGERCEAKTITRFKSLWYPRQVAYMTDLPTYISSLSIVFFFYL